MSMRRTNVSVAKGLKGELAHANERRHLIVICHGYQGSKQDPTIIYISKALNKLNYDTFTFNFSPNTGGFDIEHQVADLKQIARNFSEYDEITLLAGSFAALPAAIATIQEARISNLITLNGFFGLGHLGGDNRKGYMKFRLAALLHPTYRRIYQYYKKQLQPDRITVPVLVMHAENDQYVFIQQSEWFYDQLVSPKKFVRLETANHGVKENPDRDVVGTAIYDWLRSRETLRK